MKIGDRVRTKKGEYGTIACKTRVGFYDWSVDIEYEVGPRTGTMREPYYEDELEVVNETNSNFRSS